MKFRYIPRFMRMHISLYDKWKSGGTAYLCHSKGTHRLELLGTDLLRELYGY